MDYPGLTHFHGEYSFEREDAFVVTIPKGLHRKDDILKELRDKLRFPSYAKLNLDSLSDCLRDLSWITESHVVVIFSENLLYVDKDLESILSVLSLCALDWRRDGEDRLTVMIPDR